MPVQYAGILQEHKAVREAVGLFDVSHLGTFLIEGEAAADYLNTRVSNDLNKITPGHAQYTLLLDASGGVVDDMIVYLFAPDHVMVIPNASNADEVLSRLMDSSPDHLRWTNRHTADGIIAIQGPRSAEVMEAAFGHNSSVRGPDLSHGMGYMSFERADLVAESVSVSLTVCRTGYTGELGYELVVPAADMKTVWTWLMERGEAYGIQPCGLGARDTLRTEMGYPLHGQDLSLEISPVEARVGWAVGWKKDSFDGDEAVRTQRRHGVSRTLMGIRACGRGIPRAHMSVIDENGEKIGEVTSGTFSPTLNVGIGLAFLPPETQIGDKVTVEVRSRHEEFEVVKLPFVPSHVSN
jgi:aminomethyltransferase